MNKMISSRSINTKALSPSSRAIIPLICCISFSISSFSQSTNRFEKGYVITLQNDTINGFVGKTDVNSIYYSVQFKESETVPERTFVPATIKGYVLFEGTKIFNSKLALPYYRNSKKEVSDVFLKTVVTGGASLYLFIEQQRDKHYFLAKGDQLLELRYQEKAVKLANGKIEHRPETAYNGVFNLLLSDCDIKTYNFPFSEANCIQMVNRYNHCLAKGNSIVRPFSDYIVTLSGDTISGFIEYVHAVELYESIKFKSSEKSPAETLTPGQLKAYGLAEGPRIFESKIDLVYYANDTSKARKDMFTEVLVRGKASLLYAFSYGRNEHYFLQKDGQVLELQKKEINLIQGDGTILRKKSKNFNGIFNLLISDCNHSTYDLNYNPKEFIEQVNSYNLCKHSSSVIFEPSNRPKAKLYFGFSFILSNSVLSLDSLIEIYRIGGIPDFRWQNYQTLTNASPTLGVFFDFQQPKNKHFSLNLQAYVAGRHWYGKDVDIKSVAIELPLSVKYSFLPQSRFRPNMSYGFNILMPVYSSFNSASIHDLSINNSGARVTFAIGLDYFHKDGKRIFIGVRSEGSGRRDVIQVPLYGKTEFYTFYFGFCKLVRAKK